jgi:hypothetical protein
VGRWRCGREDLVQDPLNDLIDPKDRSESHHDKRNGQGNFHDKRKERMLLAIYLVKGRNMKASESIWTPLFLSVGTLLP